MGAYEFEPTHADGNMTNLVGIDPAQHGGALAITDTIEPCDHCRRNVETASFQDQRHDGEPRQQVMRGRLGGLPKPVMRRQIAIGGAEGGEALGKQCIVLGLLGGDANPVIVELAWQIRAGEARDDIPGKVDRVELDMRNGVEQRDPPGG